MSNMKRVSFFSPLLLAAAMLVGGSLSPPSTGIGGWLAPPAAAHPTGFHHWGWHYGCHYSGRLGYHCGRHVGWHGEPQPRGFRPRFIERPMHFGWHNGCHSNRAGVYHCGRHLGWYR